MQALPLNTPLARNQSRVARRVKWMWSRTRLHPIRRTAPKGEAHLFLGTQEVGYIFFTVLAPARADLAHVFFLPDPRANVAVADYSISLVLERGPWRTGAYSGSVGGRAAITLSNGAQYESQGANATLTVTLDRVQVAEGGTYLDGKLTVLLDAKSGGAALRAEVQFN